LLDLTSRCEFLNQRQNQPEARHFRISLKGAYS
jgi:hypothetical protein